MDSGRRSSVSHAAASNAASNASAQQRTAAAGRGRSPCRQPLLEAAEPAKHCGERDGSGEQQRRDRWSGACSDGQTPVKVRRREEGPRVAGCPPGRALRHAAGRATAAAAHRGGRRGPGLPRSCASSSAALSAGYLLGGVHQRLDRLAQQTSVLPVGVPAACLLGEDVGAQHLGVVVVAAHEVEGPLRALPPLLLAVGPTALQDR